MIVNGNSLLQACPIKDMECTKLRGKISSYGLGEAGYDIRIKQDIEFCVLPNGKPLIRVSEPSRAQAGPSSEAHGRFVLASTLEEFQMPKDLVGVVHDKSTWARKGVSVFNTVIEPGWNGFLTLEIVFHGEEQVFIPAGSGIAQVVFTHTTNDAYYTGKYQNQADQPVPAINSRLDSLCTVCHGEQIMTVHGITCDNGHDGDPGYDTSIR